MKNRSKLTIYTYINLAGIFVCLLTMFLSCIFAGGYLPNDTFYIAPVLSNDENLFNIDDVTYIDDHKDNAVISYEKITDADVDYEFNTLNLKAVYTNADYFNVFHHEFITGGPFSEKYNMDKIAVLSDKTAYYFFGSYECVGKTVRIDNVLHEVTGVVKTPDSLRERFVILNYESTLSKKNDISNLYIKDYSYSKTGSRLKVYNYLDFVETAQSDCYAVDLNQYLNNNYIKCIAMIIILLVYLTALNLIKIIKSIGNETVNYRRFLFYAAGFAALFMSLKLFYDTAMGLLWVTSEKFTVKSALTHLFNTDTFPSEAFLPYQLIELKRIDSLISFMFCLGLILFMNFAVLNNLKK